MSNLKMRIAGKELPVVEGTTKIYERNYKTIITNSEVMSSVRVTYGLASNKNPAPIEIEFDSDKNRLEVRNNMSGIKILYDDGKIESGSDSISVLDDPDSIYQNRLRIADSSDDSLIFKIEFIKETEEAPSVEEFVPSVYETESSDETDHREMSEVMRRSEKTSLVGRGQFRDAYKVDGDIGIVGIEEGTIVKVANSSRGLRANRSEIQTWQAVSGTASQVLFCPIKSIGRKHKYIVMKEADNVGQVGKDVIRILETELENRIDVNEEDYNINHPLREAGWDVKKSNIGIHKGNPVLIDYPYGGKFVLNNSETREEFSKILDESF